MQLPVSARIFICLNLFFLSGKNVLSAPFEQPYVQISVRVANTAGKRLFKSNRKYCRRKMHVKSQQQRSLLGSKAGRLSQ